MKCHRTDRDGSKLRPPGWPAERKRSAANPLRVALAVVVFLVVLVRAAAAFEGRAPAQPIAPTDPRACDALQHAWDHLRDQASQEHQQCLDANQSGDSGGTGTCSRRECQELHDLVFTRISGDGSASVDKCRAQVREHQAALADQTRLDDAQRAAAERANQQAQQQVQERAQQAQQAQRDAVQQQNLLQEQRQQEAAAQTQQANAYLTQQRAIAQAQQERAVAGQRAAQMQRQQGMIMANQVAAQNRANIASALQAGPVAAPSDGESGNSEPAREEYHPSGGVDVPGVREALEVHVPGPPSAAVQQVGAVP